MVVRDCATRVDDCVDGGALDFPPPLKETVAMAERIKRKIGRRPIRVDVGEATGDLARPSRRLLDRGFCRRLHAIVEHLEAL
jgi:hypothetical protein